MPETDAVRLANLALDVLNAQQVYFKSRSKEDLIRSKQLEKQLRELAVSVLRPGEYPQPYSGPAA